MSGRTFQSELINEHNSVRAGGKDLTVQDHIKKMRATILRDMPLPSSAKAIPKYIQAEHRTWCGIGESKWRVRVRLSLLPEPTYQQLLKVFAMFQKRTLKGMQKKLFDSDGKKKKSGSIPIQGLEKLAEDFDATDKFLRGLTKKHYTLKEAAGFAEKWKSKRGNPSRCTTYTACSTCHSILNKSICLMCFQESWKRWWCTRDGTRGPSPKLT